MPDDTATPSALARSLFDDLISRLRPRVIALGKMIASGKLDLADALDRLLDGPVRRTCVMHDLWDLYDDFEAELEETLFFVSNELESERERARLTPLPGPRVGLPAYYPAPTAPRDVVLANQKALLYATIAKAARIAGARRELERRRKAALDLLDSPAPAEKAALTRQLHREVAAKYGYSRRIPLPPRLLVTGAQGSGKTSRSLEAVAVIREPITVLMTEPTIEKCDEAARAYRELMTPGSLPVMVVRGRSQPDPSRPGLPMCWRHEVAHEIGKRGLSVPEVLCADCPFKSDCGHREQAQAIKAMDGVGFFLMAGQGALVSAPVPNIGLFIGDERLDSCDVKQVSRTVLSHSLVTYRGGPNLPQVMAAHRTIDALAAALGQPNQLAALRAAGVDRKALYRLIEHLTPAAIPDASGLSGALSDDVLKVRLNAMPDNAAANALILLRAVLREIDRPRGLLNGLTVDAAGMVTVSRLLRVRGIARAGLVLLDGTGNYTLNKVVYGPLLDHAAFQVDRLGTVIGTKGRGYSRQSITGLDRQGRLMPTLAADAPGLRRDIETVVRRVAREQPHLVIAAMAVKAALHLPPDVMTTHYNALRGKNAWERCQSAVAVGQISMAVRDLEALARCYMADDDKPFFSSVDTVIPDDWHYKGWPYKATRMRRMRDGSLQPVEVNVHPDPRCQVVYEQYREAEIVQGIDRPRPIFNVRSLVLMNDLVCDVTYDRILTHRQLVCGGTRWDLCWADTGILPFGGRDLHMLHPRHFRSVNAAEGALSRAKLTGLQEAAKRGVAEQIVGKTLCAATPLFRYRRRGQTGREVSWVAIDTARHPDPRAALSTALRCPLNWFEPLSDDEIADHARPQPPQPPKLFPLPATAAEPVPRPPVPSPNHPVPLPGVPPPAPPAPVPWRDADPVWDAWPLVFPGTAAKLGVVTLSGAGRPGA